MCFDIDTKFTARHIVLVASSPGRRLVRAMWLCRGLGQAWRLSAAKGVEKSKSKIKNGSSRLRSQAIRKIEVAKGKYARTRVCLTMKTTFYASLHLK